MAAIDVKINQEKKIDGNIDREINEKKYRQKNKKLENGITEYLLQQVDISRALVILNNTRVNLKIKQGRINKGDY